MSTVEKEQHGEEALRRVMFLGRSECGKTTLIQALRNQELRFQKTQYVNYQSHLLDTPGEYTQVVNLGRALAIYSYEVDIVAMVCSATEDYSLYAPNIAPHINREVIGVVTKIDIPLSWPDAAERWLRTAGCKTIFRVSSVTGEGVQALREYLSRPVV